MNQLYLLEDATQILISIITVGTGGLLATYLWRRIVRPDLQILNGVIVHPPTPSANYYEYRVQVKNTGRRAANNCKVKFNYKIEVDDLYYYVESTVYWSESNNPTRIKINSDEIAEFVLLRQHTTDDTITFPTSSETESEAPILEYAQDGTDEKSQVTESNIAIDFSELSSGNIIINNLKLTSENAVSSEASVAIKENNSSISVDVNRF